MKQDSGKQSPTVTSYSLLDFDPSMLRNLRSACETILITIFRRANERNGRLDRSVRTNFSERREWRTRSLRASACAVNKIWERGESRCNAGVYRLVNLIHECRSRADARVRSLFDFAWHVLINAEIFPVYECV